MVPPGIEPGTFSVLTRCHNQLDHGTEVFDWMGMRELVGIEDCGIGGGDEAVAKSFHGSLIRMKGKLQSYLSAG